MHKPVIIKINKWKKHNPRRDVKRPSWFALDHKLVEDDDFFSFRHGEFKAWIYLLSKASQKQSDTIIVNFEAAKKKSNIKKMEMAEAIRKLAQIGIIQILDSTSDAHVTSTSRDGDEHDRNPNVTDRHTDITDNTYTQDDDGEIDLNSSRGRFNQALMLFEMKVPGSWAGEGAFAAFEKFISENDQSDFTAAIENYALFLAKRPSRKPKETLRGFIGGLAEEAYWRRFVTLTDEDFLDAETKAKISEHFGEAM